MRSVQEIEKMRYIVIALLLLSVLPAGAIAQETASPEASEAPDGLPEALWVQRTIGEASIVHGDPIDSVVPIVVINDSIESIQIENILGAARTGSDRLVAVSTFSSWAPSLLAPQGVAVGYVQFSDDLGAATELQLELLSRPESESRTTHFPLAVTDLEHSEHGVIGTITNQSDMTAGNGLNVIGVCFSLRGEIVGYFHGIVSKSILIPGDSTAFMADLFGTERCEWAYPVAEGAA